MGKNHSYGVTSAGPELCWLAGGRILLPTLCSPAARGALGRRCGCSCSPASLHGSVCINTRLHCYHSPVTVTLADLSALSSWGRGCTGHPQLIPAPLCAAGRSVGWGASGWQGAATADGRWGRITELHATRDVPGGAITGAGCELVPAGPHHAPARPRHGSSVRAGEAAADGGMG